MSKLAKTTTFELSTNLVSLAQVMKENMGDEPITKGSLFRLKVPGSGGQFWEMTDENGELGAVKSVRGVILEKRKTRAAYDKPYGGGDDDETNFPFCSSSDGKTGEPNMEILESDPDFEFPPFLEDGKEKKCSECPLNEFGKNEKGKPTKKPCSERMELVLLIEGTALPSILSVPPGSLRNFSDYMSRLTQIFVPFHSVATEFGLEKVEKGGNVYSKITFANIRKLTEEEMATVNGYKQAIFG